MSDYDLFIIMTITVLIIIYNIILIRFLLHIRC